MKTQALTKKPLLPADIVLAPAWWFKNEGITFDEDFFYHPEKRVEAEKKMEKALYQRWGNFGLGENKDKYLPVVGAVHLAAGFMISEMLGCEVEYNQDAPPQVLCARREDLNIRADEAFENPAYKKFDRLVTSLKEKYGFVTGDVNWGGILNIALDLRGENLFMDMFDKPRELENFLGQIAQVIETFTQNLQKQTGSTSVSVNRNVRHLQPPVYLHSECSHTMISVDDYRKFLFPCDVQWCRKYRPFGVHFCGPDPHRYAEVFSQLEHLDFLDVGWGGNVAELRNKLPDTFLNIRLSPVEIIQQSPAQIEQDIRRLVEDSGKPELTGVCCINMDEKVTDDKITTIFKTVAEIRKEYSDSRKGNLQ